MGEDAEARHNRPGMLWPLGFGLTSGVGWMVIFGPLRTGGDRVLGLSVFGFSVGLAAVAASFLQMLLLRRYVTGARSWVLCTSIGAVSGYASFIAAAWVSEHIVSCPYRSDGLAMVEACSPGEWFLRDVLTFCSAGAVFGMVQMIVLRRWVQSAWLCVPLSAVALAISATMFPIRDIPLDVNRSLMLLAVSGFAGGLAKGLGLVFLLRNYPKTVVRAV